MPLGVGVEFAEIEASEFLDGEDPVECLFRQWESMPACFVDFGGD